MPWLTPDDNAPVGTVCRTLNIPNDIGYITAVTGALLELTKVHNWEQHGAATPAETAAHMLTMFLDFTASECNPLTTYPKFFHTPATSFIGGSQGALSITFNSAYHGVNAAEITPIVLGNDMWIPFFCAAGTYIVTLLGQKGTNFGITDLSIDGGATIDSFDWYNATAQNNQAWDDRVTIPTDGMHYLHVFCQSKRAASTGYRFMLNSFRGYEENEPS